MTKLNFAICFLVCTLTGQAFASGVDDQMTPEQQEIINNYSPLDRYVSKEKFREIVDQVYSKKLAQQVIVVDTRDQKACAKMYAHLVNMGWPARASMCTPNSENPYVSVTLGTEVTEESLTPVQKVFQNDPNLFKENHTSERRKELYNRTRNIALLSGGVVAGFYFQDEKDSGWDVSGLKENGAVDQVKKHWKEGPVQDKDGPFVNFVLHPIAGSIYYQAARISGYGKAESFGYSFFMSLLFWEYGVESLFETPSWNDIWATPVIGSLIGELFLKYYKKIEENDGKVFNSKTLGFGARLFLNSAETLRPYINGVFQNEFIKSGRTGITLARCNMDPATPWVSPSDEEYCPYFSFEFTFGGGRSAK